MAAGEEAARGIRKKLGIQGPYYKASEREALALEMLRVLKRQLFLAE
jgi:hypothetical protein